MSRSSRRLPSCGRVRAHAVLVASLAVASLAASPAIAGKVYRCGNTFQDQPCVEAKPAETRPAANQPAPHDASAVRTSAAEQATRPAAKAEEPAASRVTNLDARR